MGEGDIRDYRRESEHSSFFSMTPEVKSGKLTHHMNHMLKLFLADKMVVDAILLAIVGPPCGVADSVDANTRAWIRLFPPAAAVSILTLRYLALTRRRSIPPDPDTVCGSALSSRSLEDQSEPALDTARQSRSECSSESHTHTHTK